MKKLKSLALLAALAVSGCFSVDVATSPILGDGVEKHAIASNYGWYLFGCVPLACGNKDLDSWCPFSIFCDEVRAAYVYEKLVDAAERENCLLQNVAISDDNDVLFEAFDLTIPWVIVHKNIYMSANLQKKGGAK